MIGFYTDSLPVVMEARDPELVRNVFNGLPVAYAMPLGETDLGQALNASLALVQDFPAGSTRLIIFTDGDSVNIAPLASRPKSVRDVMFLGLGNPTKGTFIDGHQSRQEPDTLRRLATELRGTYEDVNEKHLSTAALGDLVVRAPLPQRGLSLAQLAVLAMVGGGCRISRPSPTEPVKVLHAGLLGGAGTEWLAGGGFQQDGTIVLAGPAGEGIATLGGDVQELPAPAEDSKRSGCAHTYLARLSPDAAKVIWVRHVKMDIRGECENGRARLQRMGRGRAQPRLRGADIEFRDPTGEKWPNFLYGKPAGDAGVISLNPAKPAASFALLCGKMAQDRGDQSRRVLGELCPPEKPPAVTLTITSICALQSAAAGAKGKPGATADLTGTIEIAGRKLPVKAAATFRNHDGKGDEKNAALLLDGKFALKAADLGLKTVPAASVIEVRFALTAYPASSSTAPPPARK